MIARTATPTPPDAAAPSTVPPAHASPAWPWVYAALSVAALAAMARYSTVRSLWNDDLWQIGMTQGVRSPGELVANVLRGDNMPPLYHVITALWLRVAPYGTAWLRLPSEVAVAAGIFLCGLIGLRQRGPAMGVFACVFAATSVPLVLGCAWAFRPYGVYFFCAALAFYVYAGRMERAGGESPRHILAHAAALALLAYTHYFGILICGALFLADVVRWLARQTSWRVVAPYAVAGVAFLPWAIVALPHIAARTQSFWVEPPVLMAVPWTVLRLFGDWPTAVVAAVLLGFAASFAFDARAGRLTWGSHFVAATLAWSLAFVIGVAYVYSAHVNPRAPAFVDRYFFGLLPAVFLILAWVAERLWSAAAARLATRPRRRLAVAIVALAVVYGSHVYREVLGRSVSPPRQRFAEAAEWLAARRGVHEEGTRVVTTRSEPEMLAGWMYYLTAGGSRPAPALLPADQMTPPRLEGVDTVYVFLSHQDMAPDRYAVIEQAFERVTAFPEVDIRLYTRRR